MSTNRLQTLTRYREFAAVWARLGSPALVAEELGVNVRTVLSKRKAVETALGIELKTFNDQSDRARAGRAKDQLHRHEGREDLAIENGTVVVFSDAHFHPDTRTTAFRAMLALIRELRPVAIINNGDAFDGASVSRHPRIGWDKQPSVAAELKAVDERLIEIEQAAKGAQLLWSLGNHDARYETCLAASAPQYEGVHGFSLKHHFPRWKPCWSVWVNDETVIKHRWHNGVHATYNNTLKSGVTIVTGHLHRLKIEGFSDYRGRRWGVDTGTLAEPYATSFIHYTEGNPVNWASGFVVMTWQNGRLLTPELVRKWDEDTVEFRGHLIDADTGAIR